MEQVLHKPIFRWVGFGLILPLLIGRFYFFYDEWEGMYTPFQNVLNYFGYFTIQNNLLVMLWFMIMASRGTFPRVYQWIERNRVYEALIFYALVVVVVYWGVIYRSHPMHGFWDQLLKILLHVNLLVVILLDYILHINKKRIPFNKIGKWMLYPLIYGTISVLRAEYMGWCPYPFLDMEYLACQPNMTWVPFAIMGGIALLGIIYITIHNGIWKWWQKSMLRI